MMKVSPRQHTDGRPSNPAFSPAIEVSGPHRTLFIGGQNAVDASGSVVGVGEIETQAAQVASNIKQLLESVGATPEQVVRWGIHVLPDQPLRSAMNAFIAVLGMPASPPTITVLVVAGLANPDFLIEVDAIAILPADE